MHVNHIASQITYNSHHPSRAHLDYLESQYRSFAHLEAFLARPRAFLDSQLVPLPADIKRAMLTRYFKFDALVMRQLLDAKLDGRFRKDLDEIAQDTDVPLASVRRQFENLKNVYTKLEDTDGPVLGWLQQNFVLPFSLANDYARIVFIMRNNLDASRRKLAHLPLDELLALAEALMANCTLSGNDNEFDDMLGQDIRDLKSASLANKTFMEVWAVAALEAMAASGFSSAADRGKALARQVMRTILSIGGGLAQAKEARELLLAIQEKLVEPMQLEWTVDEAEAFFEAASMAVDQWTILPISHQARGKSSLKRLLQGFAGCCVILYRHQWASI